MYGIQRKLLDSGQFEYRMNCPECDGLQWLPRSTLDAAQIDLVIHFGSTHTPSEFTRSGRAVPSLGRLGIYSE